MLAEVFRLIEEDRSKSILIYDDNHFIGKISYDEVISFLNYKKDVGDIYQHKLNFEMGTVLHIIRGMRASGEFTEPKGVDTKTLILRLTSVAVLATVLLSVAWLFFRPPGLLPTATRVATVDVPVISDKAMLTISGSNGINLTDADMGVLYEGAGVQIVKVGENQIEYRLKDETKVKSAGHPIHAITTPHGQQYQVTLSDGTKIWINAASSVNFPATFVTLDSRHLSLRGEAYFEVAQNKEQPFFLATRQQEIQVLGTHFNVTGYENDSTIKTTLLEGSLKVTSTLVNKSVLLKPGEQSSLTSEGLTVSQVDADECASWKDGAYVFRNEPLEEIMRVIERQYNIKVVYKNEVKRASKIGGTILLSSNLSDVLNLLGQVSNADFKLEGTSVTVL